MKDGFTYIGYGISLFLLCIGIGGCEWLEGHKDDHQPLIIVEHVSKTP